MKSTGRSIEGTKSFIMVSQACLKEWSMSCQEIAKVTGKEATIKEMLIGHQRSKSDKGMMMNLSGFSQKKKGVLS